MISEGKIGIQPGSDGAVSPISLGRMGEVVMTELHGRYYQAAYRGNIFVAYCAAQALSLAGTAMVGLQLWNSSPAGPGGKNLVLLKTWGDIVVTSASLTSIVLAAGTGQVNAPTGQTAATSSRCSFVGIAAAPVGLALAAGTFSNAPAAMLGLAHNTAAIAVTGEDPGYAIDLEGCVIVPPQAYVCIAAVGAAAAAAGWNGHLMWEEVPA